MWKITVLFVCIAAAATCSVFATSISYDGELSSNGVAANGRFDLRFRVFDHQDPWGSQPLGSVVSVKGILVTNGRFNVEIDLGADLGDPSDVWLEIEVKPSGGFDDFTTLEPRQRLMLPSATRQTTKAGVTPTGAIVYFASATCPAGWTEYVPGRGRFVLGLPQGGTIGATFGTPLTNQEERRHTHTFSQYVTTSADGAHRHAWATLSVSSNGDKLWTSYNSSGGSLFATAWGNGVGNEGSGLYPLSAQPTQTFYTSTDWDHQHEAHVAGTTGLGSLTLPYIQLLTCQRN